MVSLTWSLTWEGCFFGVSPGKGKFSRGDQKSFLFKHGLQAFAALRAFCGHISARGCASLGLRNFTKNWSVWSSLGGSLTSHESNTILFQFHAVFTRLCAHQRFMYHPWGWGRSSVPAYMAKASEPGCAGQVARQPLSAHQSWSRQRSHISKKLWAHNGKPVGS